ncbi:MAG: DEAD/DEAH box helicase, partial [Spirochaetes bacterium]|nr:DEAD/DEAH box helicase [Spirochaetota bacterium]
MDTELKGKEATSDEAGLFDVPLPDAGPVERHGRIEYQDEIREMLAAGDIGDGERFALKTEAWVLQLAYSNDKLLSLSNSRTQILAHQVESTHRVVSALEPRFLLADEVGLGKTIEAGLVLKEMIFRHGHRRILVVCPASLVLQWQNELRSKFNEEFAVVDRHALARMRRAAGGDNPWLAAERIICSLDFIKSKMNMELLGAVRWDTVVIDESHRLRRDSLRSTLAYAAGETLSARTKSLLLLTATPFRGKIEELYYLVRLLDKNLLGPFQTFYNAYCLGTTDLAPLREKISRVIIRRTKKDVGGFTRRMARTIRFELFPEERELYDATTRYVSEEYNRAMQSENRAVGFVMTVFQKLLASSSRAVYSALRNRRPPLAANPE